MSRMMTLFVCMILVALPTSQVSADVDESNSNPEVTIGFGNVTNDTLSFTMDTSVDVYSYQVVMSWETGAVYCAINGFGGLSEDYNLWASVLYAGCLTTGYYYGAQGIYHIPAGSNGTLTSIFYQSNSPEVCMGSASYAVLDANDELEWRNATVDTNDCLTYTKYETDDDLWYVLDEDETEDEVVEPNGEVVIEFGNVTNDTMVFTMDTSVDVYRFQVTMAWESGSLYCGYSGSGGLAQAHNLYVNVLYVTCLTSGYHYGSQGSNYIPSGSNDTLTSIYFRSMSPEVCIGNATYDVMLPNGEFETRQADFDPNDCLTYTPHETDDDFWYELDENDNESLPSSPLRFDPGNDVPTVLQDDGSFDILISALNITGLLDFTREVNSPNMGFTMIAPTDEAFQDIGFDLDDVDTQEEIDILTEILLHHTTIHPEGYTSAVVWFSDENCTEVDYELNVGNGEYAEPGNYSSWTETHTVSDDCQGNRTIGGANVTYFQGVSNGVIAVIDSVLIPDSLASPPQANEPRFNPRSDIPTNLENDGEFGDLLDALAMAMLMDDITVENSPQMGMTIFAPTDEAFDAAELILTTMIVSRNSKVCLKSF